MMIRRLLLLAALVASGTMVGCDSKTATPAGPAAQPEELVEQQPGAARSIATYRTNDVKSWPNLAPPAEIRIDTPPVPEEIQGPAPMEAIKE